MTHPITIELPDEVYQPLARKAQELGQTVEAVASSCLAQSVQAELPGSRLRRWAGAFASGIPDAASRHHDHLGQALHDELQGNRDA
jgi:hypothetical protein